MIAKVASRFSEHCYPLYNKLLITIGLRFHCEGVTKTQKSFKNTLDLRICVTFIAFYKEVHFNDLLRLQFFHFVIRNVSFLFFRKILLQSKANGQRSCRIISIKTQSMSLLFMNNFPVPAV